jgi:flagellar biosynthesis protein FlhG
VASGKGGVGKSLLATALAARSAASGHDTLLVDGDQNLGNLHVMLGVRTAATLADLAEGTARVEDLAMQVAPHLHLVPSASGSDLIHSLGQTDRARLHRQVTALYPGHARVVVDAGAGLEATVRCATMHATAVLLVTHPEASALTDAYAVAKVLTRQLPHLPIDVVINRVQSAEEADSAWERLATAAARFLGRGLGFAGAIPEDGTLRAALAANPRTLLQSPTGTALTAMAALGDRPAVWEHTSHSLMTPSGVNEAADDTRE